MYAEDLHFIIKRDGWLMTFIYEHFTFEQANLKEILSLEIKKLDQNQDLQLKKTSISYLIILILELIDAITLIIVFSNFFMMI